MRLSRLAAVRFKSVMRFRAQSAARPRSSGGSAAVHSILWFEQSRSGRGDGTLFEPPIQIRIDDAGAAARLFRGWRGRPRCLLRAPGRRPALICNGFRSAGTVGAHLRPASATIHRAPGSGTIARAIVERVVARVARTGLQAPPSSVPDRIEDDDEDPTQSEEEAVPRVHDPSSVMSFLLPTRSR